MARDIDVSIFGGGSGAKAGDITLDGGNSSGDMEVRSLRANYSGGNYAGGVATITIRNYASVRIAGDVEAWNYRSTPATYRRDGGNVTITEGIVGEIRIGGRIDLRTENNSDDSVHGTLRLTAGGTITLKELDLSKVAVVAISSGYRKAAITDELLNFDITPKEGTSGDGSLANPVVTAQTALRTPAGQVIWYDPRTNVYLQAKAYRVADLSANPGEGGLLRPIVPPATRLIIR
ncbi:MAG: hypothetical protein ACUVWX_12620 [Kiritimatiellia bacterium]